MIGSVLSMSDEAKEHLHELAKWVKTAKMAIEQTNIWYCIEPDQSKKWQPLQKSLGLYKTGNRVALYKIFGNESIGPDPGFYAIFIPLSGGIGICGKHLQPGEYIEFTGGQFLNAQVDFLTVLVQESDSGQRNFIISESRQGDKYTSGRYLFNEDIRLNERHVEFNVDAFKDLASRHIGRGKVSQLTKHAEGGFNRIFLLRMEDGSEAIAKIPYKIAVPAHYATASEAATLELLHSHGIPVPKIYGYSSTSDNEAGVEYLTMEKASGIGIESKWLDMTKRERFTLAPSFVEAENKYSNIPFSSIGSVYFKKDVPPHLQRPLYKSEYEHSNHSEKFCIGPTADYMFWLERRSELDIERGPWNSPVSYLQAIASKEILWTQKFGKPIELDFPHSGLVTGEQSPKQYIELLEKCLALAPYFLPKDLSHPWNQPILRHPDLNPNNIFISPESGTITSIIDWQYTIIEPRLLAAGYPRAFQGPDEEEPQDLKEPTLPQDYTSLDAEEKPEADELYRRRLQFHYYRILNGSKNRPHVDALYDPLLNTRQHLIDRAGRQWSGNLMTIKCALIRMAGHWPRLPDVQGVKCPIEFSEEEIKEFESLEETWLGFNTLLDYWRE